MSVLGLELEILPRNIRRVRHINRLLARNLSFKGLAHINVYYSLSLVNSDKPYYVSPVAMNTWNPSWDEIPDSIYVKDPRLPLQTEAVVRLYRRDFASPPPPEHGVLSASLRLPGPQPQHSDTLLLEERVDVKKLERIHGHDWKTLPALPANTLVYFLSDGIYSSKEVSDYLRKMNLRGPEDSMAVDKEKRVDVGSIIRNAAKLSILVGRIAQTEAETARLRELLEKRLKVEAAAQARKREAVVRAKRLAHLREVCEKEAAALDQERKRVLQLRRDLIPRAKTLFDQSSRLVRQKQLLVVGRQNLRTVIRPALQDQRRLLDIRRQKILMQLRTIFPITEQKSPQKAVYLCIRGAPLPALVSALKELGEETSSTALGYVCHVVCFLSKQLQVPLRYRILYKGSRSYIVDEVTDMMYPLFKNGEDENFEMAIYYLNRDIEQMLAVRIDDWTRPMAGFGPLEGLEMLFANEIQR